MLKIKCLRDINEVSRKKSIPKEVIEKIRSELLIIKQWSDEMDEVTIEDFNTDDFGYGYIVILEGNETGEELKDLGLTEGLENVIPECVESYYFNNEKWTKVIVIYNDSYAMSFWLKNTSLFEDYEDKGRECFSSGEYIPKEPF